MAYTVILSWTPSTGLSPCQRGSPTSSALPGSLTRSLPATCLLHHDAWAADFQHFHLVRRAHLRLLHGSWSHLHESAQSTHRPGIGDRLPGRVGWVREGPLGWITWWSTKMRSIPGLSAWLEKDGVIVDQSHQRSLPCPWEAGQCHAEGRTYIWNLTEPGLLPLRGG